MSFEEQIFLEATAAEIRKAGEKELKKTQKENKKEKKDSEWYRKQLEANLAYKRERLEWQKERSLLKDKLRRKRETEKGSESVKEPLRKIKTEVISDKDKDPTAYQKAMGGAASLAKGLATAGIAAVKRRAEKKKQESEESKKPKTGTREPKPYSFSYKSAKKKNKLEPKRLMGSPDKKNLPPSKDSDVKRLPPGNGPIAKGPSSGDRPSRPVGTLGQRARRNPELKKRLISSRSVGEEFSCWREEFLYELGELRRNKKTKKMKNGDDENIIDVMDGKNTIIIGPKIDEQMDILEARKREKVANAFLAATMAATAGQSPRDFVRTGHVEAPGTVLMQMWGKKRSEAERNLDSGRVSHPARNIKKKKIIEDCGCEKDPKKELIKAIVSKVIGEKKRKNYLLTSGIIGEKNEISEAKKSEMKCNKPKAEAHGSGETGKSHVVKACEGGKEKLIRFGQLGVKGSPKKEGESEEYASRRHRFQTRHAKNIAKGRMSAAYWANKVKW